MQFQRGRMATLSNSAGTNSAMKREIEKAVKKMNGLLKEFDKKERQAILKPAAKIVQSAAKNNIPDSDDVHFRYSTAKLFNGVKAPKGSGNVITTYHPGNLRRSIKTLIFRKSAAVFVGPKVSKSTGGEFKGARTDGYYAHWMEFGTVNFPGVGFMRRAAESTESGVIASITKEVTEKIKEYKAKHKL